MYLSDVYKMRRINRIRLDSCTGHRFGLVDMQTIGPGSKAHCSVCGGDMLLVEVNQYVLGVEIAGGDPNAVLPGFRNPGEAPTVHCPACGGDGRNTNGDHCQSCSGSGFVSKDSARQYLANL